MRLDQRTLRAIGQDLEAGGIFEFDLALRGEECRVRETTDSPGPFSSAVPSESGWKRLYRRLRGTGGTADATSASRERVYRAEDIDRLISQARTRRGDRVGSDPSTSSSLRSTAEALRVLAGYCEVAELEVVSVSKRGEHLEYDYLTESGDREMEARDLSDLSRLADGMISKREAVRV